MYAALLILAALLQTVLTVFLSAVMYKKLLVSQGPAQMVKESAIMCTRVAIWSFAFLEHWLIIFLFMTTMQGTSKAQQVFLVILIIFMVTQFLCILKPTYVLLAMTKGKIHFEYLKSSLRMSWAVAAIEVFQVNIPKYLVLIGGARITYFLQNFFILNLRS